MFKIVEPSVFIQEIKKSRFRAVATPVSDEDSLKTLLRSQIDPGANHNCWAWRIGQSYRYSDDGEPGGTAGKPILQAIDGQSLDCVLVVVTRWFGGVLLGSGGLVRAYGGTAAGCLKLVEKHPFVATKVIRIECAFADLGAIDGKLRAMSQVRLNAKDFTATGAQLLVEVPEQECEPIAVLLRDLTSGRAIVGISV